MDTDNKIDFHFTLFNLLRSMDSLAHLILNAANYIVYFFIFKIRLRKFVPISILFLVPKASNLGRLKKYFRK